MSVSNIFSNTTVVSDHIKSLSLFNLLGTDDRNLSFCMCHSFIMLI